MAILPQPGYMFRFFIPLFWWPGTVVRNADGRIVSPLTILRRQSMKSFSPARARIATILGVTAVASLLSSFAASAQTTTPPSREPPANLSAEELAKRKAWRETLSRIPLPKEGCFNAEYPNTQWIEVPCTKAPNRPFAPAHGLVPRPNSVGGGGTNDSTARVTGLISSVTGSFENIAGVTSESDGTANDYSLQINTRPFTTSACGGGNPGCTGWQQFLYSTLGFVFMQYWLIDYGPACPAGYMSGGPPNDCYQNSNNAVGVPTFLPITGLGNLSLYGKATTGGLDEVKLFTLSNSYGTTASDTALSLAASWRDAEFNIFGDGNNLDAAFNSGSRMAVRISVNDGTTNPPLCVAASYTGETNNLTVIPPCCPYGGASPAVVFWQSNNPGATSACVGGSSIGDTHLTNFNGLLFDFQASGDFLLAETDPGFVVQTRQKSGAPNWPNAAVNKAVAMQIEKTRVAVCLEPSRFVVDGKPNNLASGKSLALPGVNVTRNGNVYVFKRQSGESVRAEVNNGWINVGVDLGRVRVAMVRGLLGNVNGNTGEDDLAARDKTVLQQPVSFTDLYRRYGDSWRVPADASLPARLCGGKVENGNPEKPFYANDLNPKDYKQARAICMEAGVKEPVLLDACTLDTAVLGDKAAARVFVRANPPRAVVQLGRR
jgi:hypothetical protein